MWQAAAAEAGGSIAGSLMGLWNQAEVHKDNMEMAEYMYKKDVDMWNRANEYNLPANQMQRLKEAGLNPNLVYGKGAQTQAATQLPKYQAPQKRSSFVPPDLGGTISTYYDLKKKKADAQYADEQVNSIRLDNKFKGDTYDTRYESELWKVRNQIETYENMISKTHGQRVANQASTLNMALLQGKITAQKYENRMRSLGINSSDATLIRMAIMDEKRNLSPQEVMGLSIIGKGANALTGGTKGFGKFKSFGKNIVGDKGSKYY